MKCLLFPIFLFATLPADAVETLTIDPMHSAVVFSWNHKGLSNPVARLEKINGRIMLDTSDISKSSVQVIMPLEGLRTGVGPLDQRLKGDEFFAAARYPDIMFKSTKIVKGPMDTLSITGDLFVHGVTKPVVLQAKINRIEPGSGTEGSSAGFEADTVLRRTDYGVDRYVPAVSDDIHVHLTLEAVQAR
jgi:polyisoprenoid-binding protein YceI